jgi:hypothetical protein
MNEILIKANALLKKGGFDYVFCGGFALDLFLGITIREHSDIDVCVFQEDRNKIIDYMVKIGLRPYEFCGNGIVHLIKNSLNCKYNGNIMCIYKDCDLVKFIEIEKEDHFYHEFSHEGIKKLNYIEFLFNNRLNGKIILDGNKNIETNMQEAILISNGIEYLAPEIVLFYKSNNMIIKNQIDYGKTITNLNAKQKSWLKQALIKKYSNNHLWLNKIIE